LNKKTQTRRKFECGQDSLYRGIVTIDICLFGIVSRCPSPRVEVLFGFHAWITRQRMLSDGIGWLGWCWGRDDWCVKGPIMRLLFRVLRAPNGRVLVLMNEFHGP
jgi:hypothetical protein